MPVLRWPASLKEFWGGVKVWLYTGTADVAAKAEADGTVRVQLIGYDGSTQTRVETETTAELKTVEYGKTSGAAVTAFKTETTGEQDVVFHGKDSDGNIDPLRTNANQQLQVEIVDGASTTRKVLGRSDLSATTNTSVYTVPASTEARVTGIYVCNRNASSVLVRVGLANGAVANEDWIFYDFQIQAQGTLVIDGEVNLTATEIVVVYSDTANVSVVVTGVEYA